MSWLASRSRAAFSLALLAAAATAACSDRADTAAPRPARASLATAPTALPPGAVPIDDFYFAPHVIEGGRQVSGVIQFASPVPAGGATILIRTPSHPPAWPVPDSVLAVPGGVTTWTFPVQTAVVPVSLGVSFTAVQGTYSVFTVRNLLVTPPPPSARISGSTSSLTFATQTVGTPSAPKTVTVTNVGSATLTFSGPSIVGPFTQTSNCPASLAPGASCAFQVTYVPTAAGAQSGTLTIASDASNGPWVVSLNGTGYVPKPAIYVTPTALGFGGVRLGLATSGRIVKVSNTGDAPLIVSSVDLGGANPGDFWVGDNCSGVTLSPGGWCTVSVSFEPNRVGTRTATLTIAHNAPSAAVVVSLSGSGVSSGGYIP